MSLSKFKTYEKLSFASAIATVLMASGFYIIDCLLTHSIYSPSLIFRIMLLVVCSFLYFIYNKLKTYTRKRLILALIPHLAFLSVFASHLATHKNGTMAVTLMMLLTGFLASSLVLNKRDITTSAITLGAELTLAMIYTTPPYILPSAILLYAELLVVVALAFFIDSNYCRQYEAETKLKNLSVTDALTGCFNRKKITDLIVEGTNHLKGRYPITILMLDIDHFKNVNDTFGHEMGDEVLKYVALTAKSCIRDIDYIIRWGGEEFVVLLINSRKDDAVAVAERIRNSVQKEHKNSVNHDIPVTISIGVAEYDNESFDLSLKKADDMMYKAKTTGRNKVVCA